MCLYWQTLFLSLLRLDLLLSSLTEKLLLSLAQRLNLGYFATAWVFSIEYPQSLVKEIN